MAEISTYADIILFIPYKSITNYLKYGKNYVGGAYTIQGGITMQNILPPSTSHVRHRHLICLREIQLSRNFLTIPA